MIVQVEDFSFSYPASDGAGAATAGRFDAPALSHASLGIAEGAFCVLSGRTGCGKTTLLRALKPELFPVGRASGSIAVCGRDVLKRGRAAHGFSPRESAAQVGFVMQDPAAQIVCDTVWHELAFGLENLGFPQDEMRRRVAEAAHFLGIEPWVRRATEELSGGQQQLVNLAAVLALRPRLLLLDEPTAQLDPSAQEQFVALLGRVNRELGITVAAATHAPEVFSPYATQRVELSEPAPMGTREAAARALGRRARADEGPARDSVVRARDVHFRFERTTPWVLRGVDVAVARGDVHAFVGGNGCGKTTLLRLMAGVLRPQRGTVDNAFRADQALLPQDPKALFVCDSVAEELMEWAGRCGYARGDAQAAAERFGLAGLEARHPYDLSGGQQQKLALAKLLLTRPKLLLLDEPTKGLDADACAEAAYIVRELAREGRTVVLVTHDLDFASVAADTVSMLFDGEVACTESSERFFERNLVYRPHEESRLFGAIVDQGGRHGA